VARIFICKIDPRIARGLSDRGQDFTGPTPEQFPNLRLEKTYRDYGHDINNIDTPLEAGLGFAVKLDKSGVSWSSECLCPPTES
jgi:hypothetical protein